MQRISRAPELSATFSLDSCWIVLASLPGLLDYVDQAPALRLRQRPGLDDANDVALAGLVALIVRVQRPRAAHDLLVGGVAADDVDPHRDRLLALVGDDDALADLGRVRVALGGSCAGPGLVLGLRGGTGPAPGRGRGPAVGETLRGPLLRAELGARLMRPARPLQAPAILPRDVRIVTRPGIRGRSICRLSLRGTCLLSLRGVGRLRRSIVLGVVGVICAVAGRGV